MNKEYILEVKNLEYTYGDGTHALKGINLKIEKGKKIAIIGVNGSGKSTLFLNMNGVLKPSKGDIFFEGEKIAYDKKSLMELRKKVGIVFQNPETMLFSSNVYQEVSFGAMNLKLDDDTVHKRVDTALEDVNMTEYSEKSIHFLSYGQKKRVSIADILVMEPELIIFDEPTSSLDPRHTQKIEEIFDELNKKGMTVVISTHDMNFTYSWADYIFVIGDGKIKKQGVPEEIFADDKILEECYLEKPFLFDMFEKLKEKNLLTNTEAYPKTKEELYKLLKKIN